MARLRADFEQRQDSPSKKKQVGVISNTKAKKLQFNQMSTSNPFYGKEDSRGPENQMSGKKTKNSAIIRIEDLEPDRVVQYRG